jgi:uncharacterized cupredoxin-like copper-binding protein
VNLRLRLAALALLLVAVPAAGCGQATTVVTITIHHSAFDVTEVTVPRGMPVTFLLINEDPIEHEWLIGDEEFHEAHRNGTHASHDAVPTEVTIPPLGTARTVITFPEAGNLAYICHLPGHETYGMVGVLTVSG